MTFFFHSLIITRLRERETAKEKFYTAKRPRKTWDFNVDNMVISKLV